MEMEVQRGGWWRVRGTVSSFGGRGCRCDRRARWKVSLLPVESKEVPGQW
jgi:hypothetical protein